MVKVDGRGLPPVEGHAFNLPYFPPPSPINLCFLKFSRSFHSLRKPALESDVHPVRQPELFLRWPAPPDWIKCLGLGGTLVDSGMVDSELVIEKALVLLERIYALH